MDIQNTTITTKTIIITIIIQINYLIIKNIKIMIIIDLYTSFNNNTLLIKYVLEMQTSKFNNNNNNNYIIFFEVCTLFLYLLRLKNPLGKDFSFKTAGEQNTVLNSNLHAVLFSLKERTLLMSQGR